MSRHKRGGVLTSRVLAVNRTSPSSAPHGPVLGDVTVPVWRCGLLPVNGSSSSAVNLLISRGWILHYICKLFATVNGEPFSLLSVSQLILSCSCFHECHCKLPVTDPICVCIFRPRPLYLVIRHQKLHRAALSRRNAIEVRVTARGAGAGYLLPTKVRDFSVF